MNFHSYDYYYQGLGKFGNTNWNSAWNTTGPALIAKTHYLNSILAKYGLDQANLPDRNLPGV